MDEWSKIRLSADELHVLKERGFFEKKRNVTEKIYQQFAELVREANKNKIFSPALFPDGTDLTTGKISKGENYLGLPYILLDYPRLFTNQQVAAVRTMVWWGNFISSTLLLAGMDMERIKKSALKHYALLAGKDTWLGVHDSPWHHHFERDNFIRIAQIDKVEYKELVQRAPYLKLSRKIPINRINSLAAFSLESFVIYSKILKDL